MRLSPWGRVVAISALLVVGGSVALAIGAFASDASGGSSPTRSRGALQGLSFDLGDGDIAIVGGGRATPSRSAATEPTPSGTSRRAPRVDSGVFMVASRCPTSLLAPWHRRPTALLVPANVPLVIRTSGGQRHRCAATAGRRG